MSALPPIATPPALIAESAEIRPALAEDVRIAIEKMIELLIGVLDAADGDTDAEPDTSDLEDAEGGELAL